MDMLSTFIPIDRRLVLHRGASLPDRTTGAVLFADISGFTPLTAALTQELGPERGAEELSRQLNRIYSALITEVEQYGGSVISFSGDAITCWFDAAMSSAATQHATACVLNLQRIIKQFGASTASRAGALGIKVIVMAGPARRFLVGHPRIQTIDVLAGSLLAGWVFGIFDTVSLGARPAFLWWLLLGLTAGVHYAVVHSGQSLRHASRHGRRHRVTPPAVRPPLAVPSEERPPARRSPSAGS